MLFLALLVLGASAVTITGPSGSPIDISTDNEGVGWLP